MTQQWQWR